MTARGHQRNGPIRSTLPGGQLIGAIDRHYSSPAAGLRKMLQLETISRPPKLLSSC